MVICSFDWLILIVLILKDLVDIITNTAVAGHAVYVVGLLANQHLAYFFQSVFGIVRTPLDFAKRLAVLLRDQL